MDKKGSNERMDPLVERVTVVQVSGENRRAEVVYASDDEDEQSSQPSFKRLEQSVRHVLKAQLVAAQEAYQSHLDSVEKGGMSWVKDAPGTFIKASWKGVKEMSKSLPFVTSKSDEDETEGGRSRL